MPDVSRFQAPQRFSEQSRFARPQRWGTPNRSYAFIDPNILSALTSSSSNVTSMSNPADTGASGNSTGIGQLYSDPNYKRGTNVADVLGIAANKAKFFNNEHASDMLEFYAKYGYMPNRR